jgi:cyanophycinase
MLLASAERKRPRVVILPTASAPDGEDVFQRWANMGRDHFHALGADVEPLLVRDRNDAQDPICAQAVGEADLVYLSGGKPDHLFDVLEGTAVATSLVRAWTRGAALAGCSAGAMVLGEYRLSFPGRLGIPSRWRPGLGVVPGVAVAPHYDRFPETFMAPLMLLAPAGVRVLGIDEETALVGRDGSWQVHGPGRVTVWRGRRRARHVEGEVIRL